MNKQGKNYLLVVVRKDDIMELPLFVADTLPEVADFLGCSINTLYQNKSYNNYDVLIVEDVE